MNQELRQRMVFAVHEDDQLESAEKETAIHFSKPDDLASVTTAENGLMRRLLAHPDFEVDFVNQRDGDGKIVKVPFEDAEDDFDGRRRIVTVVGHIPIGALKIPGSARNRNQHASVVSINDTPLSLSRDGGD